MTAKRLGSLARGLFVGLLGAVLFATPAAAQSTTAELINGLNGRLLYVAIPITILVEAILIYTVLKFKDNDEAKPTKENRRLEITWTVATAVILLFVGVASYGVLANDAVTYTQPTPGENVDGVHVEAEAYQWNWNMNYPDQGIQKLTASDLNIDRASDVSGPVIVLPVDRPAYITVTAQQVLHAFHVPELGLKQDAIPGQNNTIKTTPTETGVYQGYCAEYCGAGHSKMYFTVIVVEQSTYDQFLAAQTATETATPTNGTSTNESSAALGAPAL
ncbi:MAG: cytochrome c oxidase subunit II [Halobaculum sp.]